MILLGVSGSIAAYKAVDLLRLLVKAGESVQVLMTPSATRFVAPLTFQALSGRSVLTDVMDPQGWQMAHLDTLKQTSAYVIAPASANVLASFAQGAAGCILSTTALACAHHSGKFVPPVFLAPAMHDTMWLHPATQANVKTLKGYGYQFIGPVEGDLGKVGDKGIGRMADPSVIAQTILQASGHDKK